jgi:hypothetical protein
VFGGACKVEQKSCKNEQLTGAFPSPRPDDGNDFARARANASEKVFCGSVEPLKRRIVTIV